MADPARKLATYDDVLHAPENMIAEVIDGELLLQSRPAIPHTRTGSRMGGLLDGPFDRGRGGPGGWIILDEPELHLGADIVAPDLAGWRREHMPEVPNTAFITLAPDWVCEVLSPSTARIDRGRKRRLYAREKVSFYWLIDPEAKMLEVYRLEKGLWVEVATFEDEEICRPEPFEAVDFELAALWER